MQKIELYKWWNCILVTLLLEGEHDEFWEGGYSDFSKKIELPLRVSVGLAPSFPPYVPYIRVEAHLHKSRLNTD